jgi:3',5'-cyclic-AMP phosphodiesterase
MSTASELSGAGAHVRTVLTWVHFGDLHLTRSDKQNYGDCLKLIAHANANLAENVDFAVLPGDNVEDGTEEQFLLVQQAIDKLTIPLEILRNYSPPAAV